MMNRPKIPPQLIFFILGFVTATLWQEGKSHFIRPVQRLASSDRTHLAILERVNGFVDLNFLIKLDGRVVYHSPDFKHGSSLSYRETLLWDASGRYLIFEVVGHRLFGYDVQQQRVLSERELLGAKVNPTTPRQAGFEGKWPTLN